jgi:hypothetical protein
MIRRHRADVIAGLISGVASAQSDWDSLVPLEDVPTFDEMLERFPPLDSWKLPATDCEGFFRAAVEASDLENGLTLLAVPQPLSFDSSLTVRYVGEAASEDGCIFFGFLFEGVGFDVFIWVDDDIFRVKLVWRGDEDAYLRAELLLRMFDGETLARLR